MAKEGEAVRVDGEVVGYIRVEDGEKFYATSRNTDGLVKKYNGFGISHELVRRLEERVETIKVFFNDGTGMTHVFEAIPSDWLERGTVDQLGNFEEQVFMSKSDLYLTDSF